MPLLMDNPSAYVPDYYFQKRKAEKEAGRKLTCGEFEAQYLKRHGGGGRLSDTGTSIFDPVLTETLIHWFTKPGDAVLDPFAGGSVRGVVAATLGRFYTGVDLRKEQIEANIAQGENMCADNMPVWICGDSLEIQDLAPGAYDFILTCPPYGNLEVYSDDPADISNMQDEEFDEKYSEIMRRAAAMLAPDRFAAVVVGNYRDKVGYLRDLCGLTIRAMESAGARYYNEMIIITPIGSLPVRAGKPFEATRKIGKAHQNCLVFCKGDPRKATKRIGPVEIPDLTAYADGGEDE